jgi:hypothetical protein
MDAVSALLDAGIQEQRRKLQRSRNKLSRSAAQALKRGDYGRALSDGFKAAAANEGDKLLAEQQKRIRRSAANR